MGKSSIKRAVLLASACIAAVWLAACAPEAQTEEGAENMEFTVVSEDRLPEELLKIVESKKENAFKLTYADEGYLYICIGYGRQESGGYSVTVDALYETENAVVFHTRLMGPEKSEKTKEIATYPYVVVRMKDGKKSVEFD